MEMNRYWFSLDYSETKTGKVQFTPPCCDKKQARLEIVRPGFQALASRARMTSVEFKIVGICQARRIYWKVDKGRQMKDLLFSFLFK